jgi:hypothetical protein
VSAQYPLLCLLMVHVLLKRMLVARLKGAEKRANTRPSMMKSMRLLQMTWIITIRLAPGQVTSG